MKCLYVVAEAENDQNFFHRCIEKLRGETMALTRWTHRRGSGVDAVRRQARYMLQNIVHSAGSGTLEGAYFVIAMDNDRSQRHPDHTTALDPAWASRIPSKERNKQCRHCEIETDITDRFTADRASWPVCGAVAVPVEMIESWLLLVHGSYSQKEGELPLFGFQKKSLTKKYHGGKGPKQLKDLKEEARLALGLQKEAEFFDHCLDAMDPVKLASVSPSFKLFKEQVDAWT